MTGVGTAGRVVCLGDVMVDIHVVLSGPLALGSDTPAPISFGHGGSAANTACWLARLGARAVFVGQVGDDAAGRAAVDQLRSHGVTVRVSVDPVTTTGVCLVLVTPDGERTMIPSAGANARLDQAELVDPPLLEVGDRLHVSGYSLLAEGSRTAARFALAAAGELGVPVSIDAASAAPIRAVGGERLLSWLPSGALLLANTAELAALTDDRPDGASELVDRGFTVVVKDGPRGARLHSPAGLQSVPTEPVPVLDSTGAGDAFAAGLLAALHGGGRLADAVGHGNRAGGLAVSRPGGRPGPP